MAMIDLKGLFPTVTAFIAFIITILCLFAGTQKNFLNGADLLTLYTPSSQTKTQTTTQTNVAHDFYSIHIMSYCQGELGTTDPSAGVTRNVTTCSSRTILFAFDPTQAWPKEVTHGAELDWPRVIADDFHAFRMTSRAMAVLYCMGVGAIGAVLIGRVFETFMPWGGQGLFEFWFLILGTFSISIASVIATVIAFDFVSLINAHGEGSNVSAHYGDKFLGMTWASAGLLLAGSVASFVNVFIRAARAVPAPAVEKDIEG
ncbi:hypothetical protein N7499_012927 [Penicillium canescens]|uniref:Actin cortical patch SUR7/pH-response regulator PalI n=1 Tax=Penicillium canescens TaxID=5083 RepID=A0AAD6I5R1_PENCN|nr:uncharacterized protein N7446_000427 [Penicillium canescens]KAJ6012103.1 hypothetical protein N7522_002458 [Penicillium canescens]KAJ6030509.1 hypothetical protein N7460_010775 [Penicillium canescens]KAJ6059776.1 hypothetical protein N7444_003415 [Penicillium canescens]KAJ6064247.1 hypothetical protein N7499_012927 [Penicillium canescens]KAJ6077491.1 hypothetical protein N7446_000427 [Penicillium canescens]